MVSRDKMLEELTSYFMEPVYAFFMLLLLFSPLETFFPANQGQKFFRTSWSTDLCFFIGQNLLWVSFVFMILAHFEQWVDTLIPSQFRDNIANLPFIYQIICVVLLSDFCIYWAHRLQHRVDFLWKFHSIHHTTEELDWLASYREHPVDSLYTIGIINLPAIILGFPLYTIAAFTFFRGMWAIYIHSNIKLPLGPLRYVIGSPQIHRWHHAKQRDVGNYANLSPLMDIIFGTFYCPKRNPEQLGIEEESPQNYIEHMLYPFIRQKTDKKEKQEPALQ